MVIDSEIQKKNCREYAHSHYKAEDVLRESDGKQNYKDIAKKLSIPACKVSSLQKKAYEFGLAKKLDNGFYKKLPGVLGIMPRVKGKEKEKITIQKIITRLKKKQTILPKINFVISGRISSSFKKMTDAYKYLYVVENVLRELVRKVLQSQQNWWVNKVPKGVRDAVQETTQKTPYHAAKRLDELEYTHIGQLKEIIVSNWNDFLPYLDEKNKQAFQVIMDKAIPSRNSIGHCIPLQSNDLKVVDVRFEDILKMIK